MPAHLRTIIFSLLLLALPCSLPARPAHADEITEQQLKSMFLVNVLGYVEWPGRGKPDSYAICMASSREMTETLSSYIRSRGLDTRIRVRSVVDDPELDGCSSLYLENDQVRGIAHLLAEAREHRVLSIVGEEGSMSRGGIIHLYLKERKLAFSVNGTAASANRLKINSRLLSLARKVN